MTLWFYFPGNGCTSSFENSPYSNIGSKSKTVKLTMESVKKMIHRSMNEEEEIEVNVKLYPSHTII